MAKSQDDLVERVLGLLGAIQAGQAPAAEDSALVVAAIQPKLDDLALRNVIYIAGPSDVPDAAFQWLAMLISQDLAPDFGKSMDATAITLAESRLRALQPVAEPTGPVRACYF